MAESICCDCCAALASNVVAGVTVVLPVFNALAAAMAFCCTVTNDVLCGAVALNSPDTLAVAADACCVSVAMVVAGQIFLLVAAGASTVAGFATVAAFFTVLPTASAAAVLLSEATSASAFACGVLSAV